MIIQDSIDILTEHLTAVQTDENDWQLASALEFAIKVLKEKIPVECKPDYTPVCPRGYTDCVCDPAYIQHYHPEWYEELYRDLRPEQAIYKTNGCYDKFVEDPDMEYHCYDDEDK